MAKKTDELLNQCLEIEGLLALISNREDNTPQMVYDMLRSKTAELSASVTDLCGPVGAPADSEPTVSLNEQLDEAAIADAAELEETADADVDEDPIGEMPEVVAPVDDTESAADSNDDGFSAVIAEDVDDDTVATEEDVVSFEPVVVDYEPEVAVESPATEPVQAEELSLPAAEEPLELPQYEPASSEVSTETADYDEEGQQSVLSDRFAEFTLNDKFRFRRELFGNSDIDMNEALDVVNAMSSRDEVEDYFYNDMCWDPANDDVKDFMRIVTAKFN